MEPLKAIIQTQGEESAEGKTAKLKMAELTQKIEAEDKKFENWKVRSFLVLALRWFHFEKHLVCLFPGLFCVHRRRICEESTTTFLSLWSC